MAAGAQQIHSPLVSSDAQVGSSAPLGATVLPGGVNFSLYSRDASRIELLFFDGEQDQRPARVVSLDPVMHRTYHYWHVFVPGIASG